MWLDVMDRTFAGNVRFPVMLAEHREEAFSPDGGCQ